MAAAPRDLVCPACDAHYGAGPTEPWRCDCGHALELAGTGASGSERDLPNPDGSERDRPERDPDPVLDRDRGLWALEGFLPVAREVTLGEGWTPLVDAPGWAGRQGATVGDGTVQFKLEYVLPSGSFKDRGAAATLSRAAALGVERVVEDSSGNAGAAIATYAARAGIDAEIYVPAGAKPGKLAAIESVGAEVVRVEGDRAAVTAACREAVVSGAGWYASHAWQPAFFAGTATAALEVCAQRGWEAPDAVVCPVGHGTLFLGLYRGFTALATAGWIDDVPRLLGVQAAGHAPIVDAVSGSRAATSAPNDVADGIQIDEPARADQLLEAVEATDGDVVAVDADATHAALADLRAGGFDVEPTSAAAPAGLRRYREMGVLDPGEDVVVPLTGSGLKQ